MAGYLEHIVDVFLLESGPIENIAMGSLVERTLNNSYSVLNATFALEVATRNLAQTFNSDLTDC